MVEKKAKMIRNDREGCNKDMQCICFVVTSTLARTGITMKELLQKQTYMYAMLY